MTTTTPPEGALLPNPGPKTEQLVHPADAETKRIPRVEPESAPTFDLSVSYVLQGHDRAALGRLGAAITAAVVREADAVGAAVDYQFVNTRTATGSAP